ncbi:MAG: FecR domain-containing protein, partial [Candidatus Eremiobacteraeota bacterium]|nr:FecR domain-containing protein [Candidatus Eremiobacteraeota bacterium]
AAVRNTPLLPGDYISTGQTSRAEIQFDGETAVRLGGNVQARVTNNDPNDRRMQLADGTVEVGIIRNGQGIDIDTPSITVRAHDEGDYRVSIGKDGSSWVTVRRGSVDIVTPQRTFALDAGRTLVARGSASDPSISYASAVAFDSFDDFNAQRDRTMVAALNASPNLNPSIAGYDNLDAYGQWQNVAGYGQAWVPDQTSGWAPYRDGSWTWEGGYGWTWVGYEPWGWAPYHYGRWFWANGYGWAWYPPAYGYSPAWSPALVGFFGFGVGGAGWGLSLGFGYPYVGWCPLAPYEAYYPWYPGWAWTGFGWGWPWYGYGGYGGFYGGTRIVNVTNIYNVYRNFRHGGGSGTVVGHFQHGTISGHTIAVTSRNLGGRVGSIHGALPIHPTAANERFSNRSVAQTHFSRAFDSPRFASNHAVAAHGSFAEQQRDVSRAIHSTASTPHQAAPVTRGNEATVRGNEAAFRGNEGTFRGNEGATRTVETARNASAPTQSWARFEQARGEARSAGFSGSAGARENGAVERGDAAARTTERTPSYSHEAPSYSHESSPSYARGSYPSYARPSYPSYSRPSYPSYARPSYPSYARPSYPTYSRPSYPSYSRGSYGSAPSYSRGSYSAPHQSGGGGGGSPRGGGGGGHRPPQ